MKFVTIIIQTNSGIRINVMPETHRESSYDDVDGSRATTLVEKAQIQFGAMTREKALPVSGICEQPMSGAERDSPCQARQVAEVQHRIEPQ